MCGAIGITLGYGFLGYGFLGYGFLGYGFLGYGFLGYGFLTEATAALVITLACLLLGRDQHSAAVDDRWSDDSSTPFDLPRRNDKVNPDAR